MTRTLVLVVCVAVPVAAFAQEQSLHLTPLGTAVRGTAKIVGKSVPLPPGEFTLVATRTRDSQHVRGNWIRPRVRMVDVHLAQRDGDRLRAEVVASTVLDPSDTYSKWEDEPCARGDTLFRLDLTRNAAYQQNCLRVNHLVNVYAKPAEGVFGEAQSALARQGVRLPIDVIIQATVTRIEFGEYLMVRYRFNPEAYGCEGGRVVSWAASPWHRNAVGKDAERTRFVESVIALGKSAQGQIDEQVRGRGAPQALAEIHGCNGR